VTERDRWQLWVGFIVVSMIVGLAGLFVALASLSRIGLLVDLAFLAVVAIVIVVVSLRARRQPGMLVPPSLQGLDPDSRALVSRAVSTGRRADRPELARAVVNQARRRQTSRVLLLAAWVLIVCVRVLALAGGESGTSAAIDVMVILGSLLAAVATVPSFMRARRAMSANNPRP
jgi:hypothetical protein